MCSILLCYLPKRRGYAYIRGYQSPTWFPQDSQIWHHPKFHPSPQCPYRRPLKSRQIIHRQTRLSAQRQRLSHCWHISYRKTMWVWHNSNANRLHHWSLPHRWPWPTKSSAPPFLNGTVFPRRNYSSPKKLQLTIPRINMRAYNIGIKWQHLPNTWAPQLAQKCSLTYLALSLQCFWMNPGLLRTESPCYSIYSLTLTPPQEKYPSRDLRPHSRWNVSGRNKHRLHVPRPCSIPTPKRGFDGKNNPPICHHKSVQRMLSWS